MYKAISRELTLVEFSSHLVTYRTIFNAQNWMTQPVLKIELTYPLLYLINYSY